jgi:hypothetical protein
MVAIVCTLDWTHQILYKSLDISRYNIVFLSLSCVPYVDSVFWLSTWTFIELNLKWNCLCKIMTVSQITEKMLCLHPLSCVPYVDSVFWFFTPDCPFGCSNNFLWGSTIQFVIHVHFLKPLHSKAYLNLTLGSK